MSKEELAEIDLRLARALGAVPGPWRAWLETREPTGGSSFVQADLDADRDVEMYVDLRIGTDRAQSPDARLDALLDLFGHAPGDLARLLAEVRRVRGR